MGNPHGVTTARGLVIAMASVVACGTPVVRVLEHRPGMAAAQAETWARAAFVEQDAQRAYDLFWEEGKKRVTRDWIAEGIVEMHPNRYPSEIHATEYEPILGQPAMMIFLRGSGSGEEFHYRLILHGTVQTDYRVSDFFRGSGPYPPSPVRKPL